MTALLLTPDSSRPQVSGTVFSDATKRVSVAPPLLQTGDVITSPGGSYSYQVIGAVCRLYDREELPYPCCRLQWQGKEPSWNRVGKRYVMDMSTRRQASYQVYLLSETGCPVKGRLNGLTVELVLTLFWQAALTIEQQRWWSRDRDRL